MSRRPGRSGRPVFAGAVVAVVGAAVAAGMFVLGRPSDERARRIDQQRRTDLEGASRAVNGFWTREKRLPRSLDEVGSYPGLPYAVADPVTRRDYEYRPLDGRRYELCAVFERPSGPAGDSRVREFWTHGAGRHCFALEAPPAGS